MLFRIATSKIIKQITELEDRVEPLDSQMVIKNAVSTKNVIKSKSLAAYPTTPPKLGSLQPHTCVNAQFLGVP